MKDLLGQELNLGDKVAYPTHDRSMRSQIVVGKLVGIKLGHKFTKNWDETQHRYVSKWVEVPKATIKIEARSYANKKYSSIGHTTCIEKIDSLVKVA